MTDIRTLGPNEKITEPGFYNISLDRHHSQPCDGPSVTSGVLRKMELATPADVWAFSALNPNRWSKPDTDALRLGRAMAAYVEGGMDAVSNEYLVLPADKPRRPTPQQVTAYEAGTATETGRLSVEFWAGVEADPRALLTDAEITMIDNMGKALVADPAAVVALDGIPEITMAWQDEETGLWCLSRPDVVNFDGTSVDYKKVNTQGRSFNHRVCDRRIEEHGYHMQMAFAAEAFDRLTGGWPTMVALVFQWDQPPHHVIVRELPEDVLRWGQILNRRALNRFKECLDSGLWPGPGDDIAIYQPSQWASERMLADMQGAGVPV